MYYFRYYQFDEVIIREILGKKLSGRNRKDLDDVNEKTKMSLKKCRRQVKERLWTMGRVTVKKIPTVIYCAKSQTIYCVNNIHILYVFSIFKPTLSFWDGR